MKCFIKRFWQNDRTYRPMPSQAELDTQIRKLVSAGMSGSQAIEKVADDLGRHPYDVYMHLKGTSADAAPKNGVEPTQSNVNIKQLIQRNINIVRMVIGTSFIVPGLFLITDSYMQMRVGGVFYRTIINKPYYFTIGLLLLIGGAIILAKGVREYLR